MDEFFKGISDYPLSVALQLDGAQVTAEWRRTTGEIPHTDLLISEERSDPEELCKFTDSMKTMATAKAKFALRMNFTLCSERRANIAFLRMGFLMMFRQFGYSYILNPCVDRIRQQILQPDYQILPDTYTVSLKEMPSFGSGVLLVNHPPEYRSFMVVLNMKTAKQTLQKGIIMPGLHDGADHIYETLEFAKGSEQPFRVNLDTIPFDEAWLHDSDYAAFPYRLWYQIAPELCQASVSGRATGAS